MIAPSLVMIALWATAVGIVLVKHGEPQPLHSIWRTLLAIAITASILWWGGFFAPLLAVL